tara:strand:- start:937 stop:3369 length:2433 start_codon:yes stop_codon:yes gene_type:complete
MKPFLLSSVLLLPILAVVTSCSTEPPDAAEVLLEEEFAPKAAVQVEPEVELETTNEKEMAESRTGQTGSGSSSRSGDASEAKTTQNASVQTASSVEPVSENEIPSQPIASEFEPLVPLLLQRNFSRGPSLTGALFHSGPRPVPNGVTDFHQQTSMNDRLAGANKWTPDVHNLALRSKKPSVHRIHLGQSFTIKGKEGTLVNFPAGSLAFENGMPCDLPVTVKMWEFYSLPDILLAGLSTDCDEGFLQTGGMIYLEAESAGRPLIVRENRRIKVNFNPSRDIDGEFDLFHGVKENDRVAWRRAKNAKVKTEIAPAKGSVAQVVIHDASQGDESSATRSDAKFLESFFGFVFDSKVNEGSETVTDFSKPRSFVGLGTASFSNGAKVFFDGALQVREFHSHGNGNFQRYAEKEAESSPSRMALDFQGGFLAAKIPPQHSKSTFSLELADNVRINPIIRTLPSPEGCFFLVNEHLSPIGSLLPEYKKVRYDNWEERIGDNHAVRCLQGKVMARSNEHFLNLDSQMGRHFGILSPSENTSVHSLHGQGPTEDGFAKQLVHTTSDKIENNIRNIEKTCRQALGRAQNDVRRLMRPGRNNAPEGLDARLARHLAPLGNALETLRESRDLNEVLGAAAEQIDQPEALARCASIDERLQSTIGQVEGWLAENGGADTEVLLAKAVAAAEFSSEFLSPNLGWHNLDKLKKGRNGMESYDLASDFSFDSAFQDEDAVAPKPVNTSFGPFFYAVWPKEGISSNAFVGKNNVPKGEFKAIGFAVDENGGIFADFKDARTGEKVGLDLKAMEREIFRKTVSGWQ